MSSTQDIIKLSKNLTVLYVEDDDRLRNETVKVLNYFFKNIIVSTNGKEGFDNFKKNKIDLIISDICMPQMNGLDMISHIKEINDNIPIIIFSAYNEREYLMDSIELGIDQYLLKPMDFDKFKKTLKKTLDKIELRKKTALLNDYENALQNSSIISKLDVNGNFIYVNDKFCETSKYSKEELLNNSFNLIRENKIKNFKKVFSKLNINKNTWNAKLRNRDKNSEYFWLNTSINPIYGENNKIKEYLVIYNDITVEERRKKRLKNKFKKTKYNLKDALKLTSQYEMAINESNILSKTNLKGKITYVNDKFCDISGYTKDELIGKNHNIIRHQDMSKKVFKDLWKTIQAGSSWQGIVKNKRKDNSAYWVSTTIIPIKNKKNKIKEYLAIRHDLTELFELHNEIEETQREIVYKLGEIGETRSKETGNHVKRVAQYSKDLALLYGLDKKECDLLFAASPMHDIGKVGIPDEILKKPAKLTNEEFEIMKGHANIGYKILKGSKRPVLKAAAIIAREHHEKFDGSGYPRGLKGKEIHIYGRITAIADVFDALGSDRYYKKAWEDKKIFNLLEEEKGKHFDPQLVDLFMNNLNKFIETRNRFKD